MQRTGPSATTSDIIRSVSEHMLASIQVQIRNISNYRSLCDPKPLEWPSARLCRREHLIGGTDPVDTSL
jgi:hypothetical protein